MDEVEHAEMSYAHAHMSLWNRTEESEQMISILEGTFPFPILPDVGLFINSNVAP